MKEQFLFFKIISLGGFYRQFDNSNNVQNKPVLILDEKRRKWGNNYLVFNNFHLNEVKSVNPQHIYVGKFEIDKNLKSYLKLFKRIDIPFKEPDYYIVTMTVETTERLTTEHNLISSEQNSFSNVFSSAFHYANGNCLSENILIVKENDILILDNKRYMFDKTKLAFIEQ